MLFSQFLRIRLASALANGDERETSKDLMERLSKGEVLEIAGYEITSELAESINQAILSENSPPQTSEIHWLEVTTDENGTLMPPSEKVILGWRNAGANVATSVISGEQFWATQEIATAPPLIDATRSALAGAIA
jgi:hypothetical protein